MSFWLKRDTNQMPLMQANNITKALQLDAQNSQKVAFTTIPTTTLNCASFIQQQQQQQQNYYIQPQTNNQMNIEVDNSEAFTKNVPILLESQSQHSTDASSNSCNSNTANSPITCIPSFDQYIEQSNMQELSFPSAFPLSKTQTNEDVYFPRVFSNKMIDVQEPSEFLKRHQITPSMRAKMIDWMIEVLKAYNYSETTFSLSVAIMDSYFANVKRNLCVSELHIVGVTSMFIASKYEEIIPFTLQKVYEKIAHEKISMSQIKQTEADILNTLSFNLTFPTLDTLANLMIKYLDLQEFFNNYSPDSKEFFKSLNTYMYKLATFDYELVSQYNYKVIAVSSVFVSIKVMEQYFPTFNSYQFVEQLLDLIGLNYTMIIQPSTRLLTLAKSFEQFHPNLKNLKKYNLEDINQNQAKIAQYMNPIINQQIYYQQTQVNQQQQQQQIQQQQLQQYQTQQAIQQIPQQQKIQIKSQQSCSKQIKQQQQAQVINIDENSENVNGMNQRQSKKEKLNNKLSKQFQK